MIIHYYLYKYTSNKNASFDLVQPNFYKIFLHFRKTAIPTIMVLRNRLHKSLVKIKLVDI